MVTPLAALRFKVWFNGIIGAADVFINFFKVGVVDPILEARHGG